MCEHNFCTMGWWHGISSDVEYNLIKFSLFDTASVGSFIRSTAAVYWVERDAVHCKIRGKMGTRARQSTNHNIHVIAEYLQFHYQLQRTVYSLVPKKKN